MSGGSFDYTYNYIKEMYQGEMQDSDLEELLIDFCEVLHDLEWWQSGDISEEDYRETVRNFKSKWFSGYTEENDARIERVKKTIIVKIKEELDKI